MNQTLNPEPNRQGSIEAGLCMARKRIWEKAQEEKDAADEELREELLQVTEKKKMYGVQ